MKIDVGAVAWPGILTGHYTVGELVFQLTVNGYQSWCLFFEYMHSDEPLRLIRNDRGFVIVDWLNQ